MSKYFNCRVIDNPEYKKQLIDEFKGNPLIEALPMINLDETAITEIEKKIEIRPEEQEYEPILKSMCIRRLNDLFIPLTVHFKLYKSVSALIRRGYINRSFTSKAYEKMLYELHELRKENIEINSFYANDGANHSGNAMLVVGDSGMGKSRSIMRVLEQYPQLIVHQEYNGVEMLITQIVWLKIDCPFDGSVKGLCINFFRALDSSLGLSGNKSYEHIHGRTAETVNKMFSSMAMLARRFCIGVLVIDEIQYCLAAGTNINKFLQYLVTLENSIGIPTIYIGTAKTEKLINREFTVARRLSSAGVITMKRLEHDDEYDYFLNEMWKCFCSPEMTKNRLSCLS